MKRVISLILIFSFMFTSVGIYSEHVQGNTKTKKYVLKLDERRNFTKLKSKERERGNISINHKQGDEEYLAQNNSIVLNLTEEEKSSYERMEGITIEEDKTVEANELKEATAIGSPYTGKNEDEYSDKPENFVPCKAVTGKESSEIIPWNISCVAGTPSENKYKGKHIKVAVIDSGIDVHDELLTKEWVDFSDKVEGYKPIDSSGHGTSTAGVIAARINGIGLQGIASEADLYSIKVLDKDNRASISTIVKAIEWCIKKKVDVINMSFGMNTYSEVLSGVIKKAYCKNILMVSAAGNNVDEIQYPAKYKEVLSVGSIDENLKSSGFSKNKDVDLVAPGENAQSIGFLGSYTK